MAAMCLYIWSVHVFTLRKQDSQNTPFMLSYEPKKIHILEDVLVPPLSKATFCYECQTAKGYNLEAEITAWHAGGWQAKASLAQALMEPDILLLDEPTNALDVEGILFLQVTSKALMLLMS